MITHAVIQDFRSFGVTSGSKPQEFDLHPLTILVGDNSAGKSNILRALSFATSPSIGDIKRSDFFIRMAKDKARKAGEIDIRLISRTAAGETSIHCIGKGSDQSGYRKEFTIDGTKYAPVTGAAAPDPALVAALAPHEVFLAPTVRDVAYLSSAKDLLPLATRSTITGTSKRLQQELTKKLLGVCKQLQGTLNVKGITAIPILELEELMGIVKLGFEVDNDIKLPLQNLGQGHISKAILKLAEIQGAQHTICIEEPEIHVHPTGIKSLLSTFKEVVKQPHRQIIVTTHAESVVNNADFDHLLVVRKEGQRSVVNAISPKTVGLASSNTIENTILRKQQRGALFLSKFVLLVEGPFDRMFLELVDRNGALGLVEQDVLIVEIGGKGEYEKYHKLLTDLKKPFAVLLDNDTLVETLPGAAGTKDGVVIKALKDSGYIKSQEWTAVEQDTYISASVSRKRKLAETVNNLIRGNHGSVVAITHGHHDIHELILECFERLRPAEKSALAHQYAPDVAPHNLEAAINRVRTDVKKKSHEMIKIAALIPMNRYALVRRMIRPAVSALKQV